MCLAIPGKVITIEGKDTLSRVGNIDFNGVRKEVSLAYLPEVSVGDYVIVHAGFAISILDEAAARDTLQAFESLGDDADKGMGE